MRYWLLKSEPDVFSIDDLAARPNQTEPWDGVRNYQARNYLRDEIQIGDLAFFYHSNCDVPGIVGIVEIVKAGYPDNSAFDPKHDYYDPKIDPAKPTWYCVDVRFKQKFNSIISREFLKNHPTLSQMRWLAKGSRLSVVPLSSEEWKNILNVLS